MQELWNGREKADVCQEFGLINSMIPMMWKNRTTIISVSQKKKSRIKQFQKPEWSDIDEMLLKWFKQDKSTSVPLSGHHLMTTFVLSKC